MIKSFDEFKNSNAEPVEEGLFDAFKARNQIVKVQGLVADKYEELLQKNPKQFHNSDSVLRAVEDFAKKTYEEVVTVEDAITFDQWWKDFSKAHAYMLDRTIFNK